MFQYQLPRAETIKLIKGMTAPIETTSKTAVIKTDIKTMKTLYGEIFAALKKEISWDIFRIL